jgi:hypothetical protein
MTDFPTTVTDRDDVYRSARDLTASDADRICHELDALDDGRVAVWLPDWLAEDKPLTTVENARRVALAWMVRTTDKAVGVSQIPPVERSDNTELIFVPKSQARVFERGKVESLSTPQTGLGDYA